MKRIIFFGLLLFAFHFGFSQNKSDVHLNKIIDKLEHNKQVLGVWASALHPSNAIGLVDLNNYPDYKEALNKPMIDFILIDMEHQPYDIQMLQHFLLALNSKREVMAKGNLQPNIATLVRIPADGSEPVQSMIKQVLDVGAHGIVVPHVRTAQQARKIISAFRYPQHAHSKNPTPIGVRGASPWLCSYLWGLSSEAYVKRADVWPLNPDGDLLAVLMIEDVEGAENIDDILQVKGVGAVLFGPYDFSFSIGHPGETDHPDLVQYREKVKKACEQAQVPLIGFANSDNILSKIEEDYKILLIGHDVRNDGSVIKVIEQIKDRY